MACLGFPRLACTGRLQARCFSNNPFPGADSRMRPPAFPAAGLVAGRASIAAIHFPPILNAPPPLGASGWAFSRALPRRTRHGPWLPRAAAFGAGPAVDVALVPMPLWLSPSRGRTCPLRHPRGQVPRAGPRSRGMMARTGMHLIICALCAAVLGRSRTTFPMAQCFRPCKGPLLEGTLAWLPRRCRKAHGSGPSTPEPGRCILATGRPGRAVWTQPVASLQ